MKWIRTMKRRPGSDWRDGRHEPAPGPWHVQRDTLGSDLTWCGVRASVFNCQWHDGDEPPDDGRRCDKCQRAIANGRPVPFQRRSIRLT